MEKSPRTAVAEDRPEPWDGSADELPPVARDDPKAALIASERRARALFEGIEDAVFVHDMDGRILDANPAASRRLGYTREEFLRLTTREIDDPSFAEGYEDRLAEQLSRGSLHCEGRHRTKDGRIIPVDINTSTIVLEDRPVVLAVIRDITERKALEVARAEMVDAQAEHARQIETKNREMSRSEARYRMLTEASLDAVVVADSSARITLFNPSAEKAFGYAAAEVLGQPLSRLLPGGTEESGREFLRLMLARDPKIVGRTLEMEGCRKGGARFPLEISISAIETSEEVQFLGSIRDQTDRHKMTAMLAQSEKLASIGLLSAGVAHEINNPLAFVGNNLAVLDRDLHGIFDLLVAYESADPIVRERDPGLMDTILALREDLDWDYVRSNLGRMLTRTREGVGRVASIVQTMRGLARTAPPEMESASLSQLVTAALELIQGRVRKDGIEVRRDDPAEPLPPLACVPTLISQVLINLFINAIQAIEMSSKCGEKVLSVALRREADAQVVEITDSGDGIADDELPRLFDPFYTTKDVGEGTGLGLSITHGIMAGHGGLVEVEGRPGLGARFRLRLPEGRTRPTSPPRADLRPQPSAFEPASR